LGKWCWKPRYSNTVAQFFIKCCNHKAMARFHYID
jgi:hypothetical protein